MPRLVVSSACWLTAALLYPVGRVTAQDSLGAATQDSVSPSPGLTPERVARGRALFHGVGACAACHDDGVGTTEGPSLVTGPLDAGRRQPPVVDTHDAARGLGQRRPEWGTPTHARSHRTRLGTGGPRGGVRVFDQPEEDA